MASPLRIAAALVFAGCTASLLAQHSPAPDGPAEQPQKTGRGPAAPGVHPPSPMSGNRFAPGPPPPPPDSTEVPTGQVMTTEKISTPVPTPASTPSTASVTPARASTPAPTPAAGSKKAKPKTRRPARAVTPAPTKAPAA